MSGLSERDMRILAFERRGWRSPGAKEQAISDVLDLPATRYYQLLNELIDNPRRWPSTPGWSSACGLSAPAASASAPPGRRAGPRDGRAAGQDPGGPGRPGGLAGPPRRRR